MEYKYQPKTKEELQKLCDDKTVYLGDIDTSLITDMSGLFAESERKDFSGIETWNVSNVTVMRDMFAGAFNFNADISRWDVSKVEDMSCMFRFAEKFNQPIGNWDVSNVTDMFRMFNGAKSFNQTIGSWDTSKVKDMSCMFALAKNFNQPIGNWDVSQVTDMSYMFFNAKNFNQPIGKWNVFNVTDMSGMFEFSSNFNQDISGWKLSQPASEKYMFSPDCPIKEKFKPSFTRKEIIIQRNIDGLAPATIRLTPDDDYALYNSLLTKFTVLDKSGSQRTTYRAITI